MLTKNLLLSEDMPFAIERLTYRKKSTMADPHYHTHYELLYVFENERGLAVNNRQYSLNSATIALIPPYTPHRTIAGEGGPETRILVNFTESFIHRISELMGIDLLSCFDPSSPVIELGGEAHGIRLMLERLLSVYDGESAAHKSERAELILSDILLCLQGLLGEREYNRSLFDITKYIETHFSDRITLDSLAKRFFMSKYTLLRKFKRHTGMGLPAYINAIRIINAKRMLRNGAKVAEAAMSCGFESLSNFDRVFRKETTMTPREYVRREREER